MTALADPHAAISTAAEDRFVQLFAEAFGIEKVQLLSPEHPVQDIYGATRFVDFAIRTPAQRVAFEIDGLVWHHPEAISTAKFEDDLLRQNSLIHDAWRVYRWTDRQLAEDGERVKEQRILFLGAVLTTKWSSSYTNPVLHSRQEGAAAGLDVATDFVYRLFSALAEAKLSDNIVMNGPIADVASDACISGETPGEWILASRRLVACEGTRQHQDLSCLQV